MRVSRETRPPPRKQRAHMRWFRSDNRIARHLKWHVVAAMTGASITDVVAIAIDLLGEASAATPRGSIADYSVLEGGAALGISPEQVSNVLAAFEKLGWVDQDFIATWDEYQPARDGDTGAERQRRHRARKKAQRTAPNVISSVTVTRDTVTVTPTLQNNLLLKGDSEAGNAPTPPDEAPQKGLSGKEVDWKAEAETDGLATIMRRRQVDRKAAKAILTRWLTCLRFDHEQLCIMLGEAELRDLKGLQFEEVIGGWINEKRTRGQHRLPLGPTVVAQGGRQ